MTIDKHVYVLSHGLGGIIKIYLFEDEANAACDEINAKYKTPRYYVDKYDVEDG